MIANPGNGRELHPDTAELLGLNDTDQGTGNIPMDSIEHEKSGFEEDYANFVDTMQSWRASIDKQLVPTIDQLPEGFESITNTHLSPYSYTLIEVMELIRRGAPFAICAQTSSNSLPNHVAVYSGDTDVTSAYSELWTTSKGRISTPQNELVREIDNGTVYGFQFDPKWRSMSKIAHSGFDQVSSPGFIWAEQNGLAVPAFMSTALLKQHGRDNYKAKQEISSQDDLTSKVNKWATESTERLLAENRQAYERFAAELDDEGKRKFKPLGLEQVAGFALSSLYRSVENNPALNERLKLEDPILAPEEDPAS